MLRDRVLLDVHLDARSAVGEHQEIRLAEIANTQNAATRRRIDAGGLGVAPPLSPWARTSSVTFSVRSNRCGYALTPSSFNFVRLARRCWICSSSEDI